MTNGCGSCPSRGWAVRVNRMKPTFYSDAFDNVVFLTWNTGEIPYSAEEIK